MISRLGTFYLLLAAMTAGSHNSFAASFSEDISGDLSDSHLTPNVIVLDTGSNTVTANVFDTDDDFFTLRVLSGAELTTITLFSYNHNNFGNTSFIGFQDGSNLDQAPADLVRGEISFALIGTDEIGTVLNAEFESNASTASSSFPLPAGDYAFWLNETDDNPASVTLGFEVTPVPEPSSSTLFLAGFALLLRHRTRHIR